MTLQNRARVRDVAGKKSVTIELYEIIDRFAWIWDGETALTIRETLAEHADADEIHVRINTDGGDVSEGIAIMTALAEHPAKVVTHNDGRAFSMGSAILLSGDERRMSEGADIMAHLPWTFAIGNSEELRDVADRLDSKAADLARLYAKATGHTEEQWMEWLRATTWWSADEALRDGLIDEITATVAARAELRGDEYPNIPARLVMRARDTNKDKSMAANKPEKKPDDAPVTPDVETIRQQERDRVTRIQAIGGKLSIKSELIKAAIDNGKSVDEFRALAVDEFQAAEPPKLPAHGRAHITAGTDASEKLQAEVTDWLVVRAGQQDRVSHAAKLRPQDRRLQGTIGDGGRFRGSSLMDIARYALGDRATGRTKTEIVRDFFMSAGGPNTSADFTVAFENALWKVMLGAFMAAPSTWRRFCATGTVTDFRAQPRYRRGFLARLPSLNEGGELEFRSLRDAAKETNQIDTKGYRVGITREVMINDDMGFLNGVTVDLGMAAARSLELLVYELLAENGGLGPLMSDGLPLFDAAHRNIGASAVLSIDAVAADILQFKQQRDINDEDFLDITPSKLLVPTSLSFLAKKINSEVNDFDSGSTVPSMNVVQGAFNDVIDSARLTGTRRYMFADPGMHPTIEVVFLEGEGESPTLEAQDQWSTLGREWRIYHDTGASAISYEGALTNAGA